MPFGLLLELLNRSCERQRPNRAMCTGTIMRAGKGQSQRWDSQEKEKKTSVVSGLVVAELCCVQSLLSSPSSYNIKGLNLWCAENFWRKRSKRGLINVNFMKIGIPRNSYSRQNDEGSYLLCWIIEDLSRPTLQMRMKKKFLQLEIILCNFDQADPNTNIPQFLYTSRMCDWVYWMHPFFDKF